MVDLFGKKLTRDEILRRVGGMSQIAGAQAYELSDGSARGSRVVRLYNAAGLDFDILAEKGMGIGRLVYQGIPISWLSSVGTTHPTYLESQTLSWLRNWPGGFLTPCGLTQVGAPCQDNGETLGIHGRLANLPASNLSWGSDWQEDKFTVWVEGNVHETAVFAENISLHRRIWTTLDEPRFWIEDRVENHGFEPTPHMFLQHINIGFPLVDSTTRLVLPGPVTTPRDEPARAGLESYNRFDDPVHGYQEQVFYHTLSPDEQGNVEIKLVNPAFDGGKGLGVSLCYPLAQYPVFVEWKMMGEGIYVVGLEPANCHVEGRCRERERGSLVMLQPQETRTYWLEIGFF